MKKIIIPIVVLAVVAAFMFYKGWRDYCHYAIPNEQYFGEQYKELLYPMSSSDKIMANEIMKDIDEAFCFVGSREDADRKYGELSEYCITFEGAVTEKHELKLVTADFGEDTGYLWFEYSQTGIDKNNQETNGSSEILVRADLKKTENGWEIVQTKEHP